MVSRLAVKREKREGRKDYGQSSETMVRTGTVDRRLGPAGWILWLIVLHESHSVHPPGPNGPHSPWVIHEQLRPRLKSDKGLNVSWIQGLGRELLAFTMLWWPVMTRPDLGTQETEMT